MKEDKYETLFNKVHLILSNSRFGMNCPSAKEKIIEAFKEVETEVLVLPNNEDWIRKDIRPNDYVELKKQKDGTYKIIAVDLLKRETNQSPS